MKAEDAFKNAKTNINRGTSKYYKSFDQFADVEFTPKFTFDETTNFFTIGSCFARNVENYLVNHKIPLLSKMPPVSGEFFKLSGGPDRAGYQNVYTPGSVLEVSRLCQYDQPYNNIIETGDLHYDLLTHGLKGVPEKDARSIRDDIKAVYDKLKNTDTLIITLGYIEAWLYKPTGSWVNQSPAEPKLRKLSDDFEFHILGYEQVYSLLNEALDNFKKINPDMKFVLTVSPVPLASTFSQEHVLVANQRSKAILHTVAQQFWKENNDVDYFPSYEMVSLSDRNLAFEEDNVHVKQAIIARVMERFFSTYFDTNQSA